MTDNVNVNIDKDMAERLVPFILKSTSDNVLEDLMDFVGVLSSGLAISEFEKSKLLIGHGIGYLASRIGWYCLEHLDDFLSIVRERKRTVWPTKKPSNSKKSGSAHHTALSLFSFRPEYI